MAQGIRRALTDESVVIARGSLTAEDRFWAKVDKNGPVPDFAPYLGNCWIWTGAHDADGYGNFWPSRQRHIRAHRFAYELENGPIPDDLHADHLCRVPACVRPSHLEPVTHTENLRRGLNGELKTHCVRGHPRITENLTRNGTTRQGKPSFACRLCKKERRR